MGIMDLLKTAKRGFAINEVEKKSLPEFPKSAICRKQLLFEGLVQQVGFCLWLKLQLYIIKKICYNLLVKYYWDGGKYIMSYYLGVLKKYAVFEGRASRKEYWFLP